MWPFSRRSRRIRSALQEKSLQQALERASRHHQRKFEEIERSLPLEEIKAKARAIKEECLANLPGLIKEFAERAIEAGARVYLAVTPEEALTRVEEIVRSHGAKLVLKAKSMVSEEIGLNAFLESQGIRVIETDLGEWIVQLAGERPSHITAPALHKTKEEIAKLLSQHLRKTIPPDPQEITRAAREFMRPLFFQAEIGISGANLAIAESGTLVILSNEGNARLVTSLPPVHIAIITVEKIVATMEQAVTLIKALVAAASGRRLTSYLSFITGPSSTTDIEKEQVIGAHGPRELHIILLDNGRTALADDPTYREILACLKCGGCMLVCPVFQSLGGHIFGGPVYPGGIGLLLTVMTRSPGDVASLLSLCADCKKCETFCPVGIHSGKLIARLKTDIGPSWGEKILSLFMQSKGIQDLALRLASGLQRFWQENDHLKPLPLPWIRGKKLPLFKPGRRKEYLTARKKVEGEQKPKIYLFEGCMARWLFPEIREKVTDLLDRVGFEPVCPADQTCCGAPSFHLGDKKGLVRLLRQNLRSLERENPAAIITVCPTGHHLLTEIYPEIEPSSRKWANIVFDLVSFIEKTGQSRFSLAPFHGEKIFYHPPCHLLASGKTVQERLHLFRRFGLTVDSEPSFPACCGFCGVFSFKNPELAAHLWAKKKEKIIASGSRIVVTECPGCLFQLKSGLAGEPASFHIHHLAELWRDSQGEEKRVSL